MHPTTTAALEFDVHVRDLADAAFAANAALIEAWRASARDATCDAASAEGHEAANDAAQAAERAAWHYAIGRKAEARRVLQRGLARHAAADEATAWLRDRAV